MIGIPSSGKSTIGQQAAEILQIPFYNTDKIALERLDLEHRARLFTARSNERLEEEHRNLIIELTKLDGTAIIEIWPESVLVQPDANLLKKLGTIIYVKRKMEIAIADAKKSRPQMVLCGMNTGEKIDMLTEGIKLYAKDIQYFENLANFTLDNNGSVEDGVKKLIAIINATNKQC